MSRIGNLDPIRHEVMTGRGIVALDIDGGVEERVREAAAVCGREADVRVLYLSRIPDDRIQDSAIRRLGPGTMPSAMELGTATTASRRTQGRGTALDLPLAEQGEAIPATGYEARFAATHPTISDLPPLTRDEATGPGSLLVIQASEMGSVLLILMWLGLEAVRRAAREGREPPMIVAGGNLGLFTRALDGWDQRALDHARDSHLCHAPADRIEAAFAPPIEMRERWARAVASAAAAVPVTSAGDLHHVTLGGRTAVAEVWPGERHGRDIRIVEIDVRGWTSSARLPLASVPAGAESSVIQALRIVLRAGVRALPGIDTGHADSPRDGGRLFTHQETVRALGWYEDTFSDFENLVARPADLAPFGDSGANVPPELERSVHRVLNADPGLRGKRLDLLRSWPAFPELLLLPDIRAAADAGVPLAPQVARALGVSTAIARRLVGVRETPEQMPHGLLPDTHGAAAELGFDAVGNRLGEVLTAFGHDRLPARGAREDWMAFRACCNVLARIVRGDNVRRVPAQIYRDLLCGTPAPTWSARAEAIDAFNHRVVHSAAADMLEGLARWGIGLGIGRIPHAVAMTAMAGHGSIPRLMEACRRWHDVEMLSNGHSVPPGTSWPVPFAVHGLGDGWSARVLASGEELRAEGSSGVDADGMAGLQHCVSTYGPQCYEGRSLIVSLRHDDGTGPRRVSTAELVPGQGNGWSIGGMDYSLTEHRGRGNGPPGAEAEIRLHRLFNDLGSGRVPVDTSALSRRDPPEGGYPRVPAAELLPEWLRILPPSWSALDLDGVVVRFSALVAEGFEGGAGLRDAA